MIKFKIFNPYIGYDAKSGCKIVRSAAYDLNLWLEQNPDVEIISWQTTAVGNEHELYITIQYKENQ